jgi:hypothetical protein
LSPTDAPPDADAPKLADTVVVEPDIGSIPRVIESRGTIRDVRLARGPGTVWMGVRTFGEAPAGLRYDFHLKLFGGADPARVDVAVSPDGTPSVLRAAADGIDPGNIDVALDGDTVWIGMPSGVLAGRTSCMAGAETHLKPGEWNGSRSAWRRVRLR